MNRIQNTVNWISISMAAGHVFCCGIPIVFSALALLANAGMVASMPLGLDHIHHVMHDYEMAIIIASAVIVSVGWGLHFISQSLNCRDTGCSHPPCDKKKNRSSIILQLATVLFIINVLSYFMLHT